jgi:hypothetical protein
MQRSCPCKTNTPQSNENTIEPQRRKERKGLFSREDLSYNDIAVAMDTNVGTVKSRLFQARKALRRLVRPQTLKALASELGEREDDP